MGYSIESFGSLPIVWKRMSDLGVSPPDSLVKYDAPLFVGIEPSSNGGKTFAEGLSKLDDMINSMLPPRFA